MAKRNLPPSDSPRAQAEDQQITNKRLKELFTDSASRKVIHTNKGFWCQDQKHVRLDNGVNHHQYDGMTWKCDKQDYVYMDVYQALYLLESGQLIIFYNELPLSVAEAYSLFLTNRNEIINHTVFSHLNRAGFFCFKSEFSPTGTDDLVLEPSDNTDKGCHVEPLYKMDDINLGYDELLRELRLSGPSTQRGVSSDSGIHQTDKALAVAFDIYKRESYNKNKPKKNKAKGVPDYHVIVCDKTNTPISPNDGDLTALLSMQDTDNVKFSGKILIALVDADSTISFTEFGSSLTNEFVILTNNDFRLF